MKKTLTATKNFVVKHKVAFAVTATAIVTTIAVAKITDGALNSHVDFLEEKDLTQDYLNWITENV